MKAAHYLQSTITIDKIPREDYQFFHEASMRGHVTCIHCQEEVQLYLGFQHAPAFSHKNSSEEHKRCLEEDVRLSAQSAPTSQKNKQPAQKESDVSINGFRLPNGRQIDKEKTYTPNPSSPWSIQSVTGLIPFTEKDKPTKEEPLTPYQQQLGQKGIHLDDNQREAVESVEGPLLVLAGAGSGKTRVLTSRTAHMICEQHINPSQIMLVTFTAKAAKEMKSRLQSYPGLTPGKLRSLVVGTFHSIFFRMLTHHDPEKWSGQNLLKQDWQRERIIKMFGREIDLDEKEFAFDQALQQISYWKNTLLSPNQIKPADDWEEKVKYLYEKYEAKRKEANQFDFDDMLIGCYELLKENEDVLLKYQERFQYFLVDEFQDVNKVQYEIIKLLSNHTKNLCVVGDDDQSIYAFRGSDPSFILNFDRDYPSAKIVILNKNYRSCHSIVESANKVITANKNRRAKQMNAQFDSGAPPLLFSPYDEEEEATMIVTDMKERIKNGEKPEDFAVLFRTHAASRALFERLSQSSLPFVIDQDLPAFYERRVVKTLLAYLRLSLNPNDVKAVSDLLPALFIKQTVLNDLKAASILEDCTMLDSLTTLTNIKSFQQKKLQKIVPLFKALKKLKPVEAITMIEKELGFSDFIKKQGNEGNKVDRGSDDVRDLKTAAKKFRTIGELLEHADHMTAMNSEMKKISKTNQRAAIQLTTIHRSKGLEWKHVYLLGAVDGSMPHDYALESLRNGDSAPLEEERRLMYVAMTRAQTSLRLSVPQMRRGKTAKRSRFLNTLVKREPSHSY